MTVTVEVKNQETLGLLKAIEDLGLIHMSAAIPPGPAQENKPPRHWLRGIHKNIPGVSVENFLARCREEKEHEFAIEERSRHV